MVRVGAVVIAVLIFFASGSAHASGAGTAAIKNWGVMDQCAREAQAAYPDYTAEAYAKRYAKLKTCLAGKDLPPRAPLAPPN